MKRPVLHRLFSGFMALLVLITSMGLTVQTHTCRSSGRSTAAIIFSAPEHQCPPALQEQLRAASQQRANKAPLRKSCCEFGAHFHKLDAASLRLNQVKYLTPPVLLTWLSILWEPAFSLGQLVTQPTPWHASDSSPPLRAGRQLLAFVCTWQV